MAYVQEFASNGYYQLRDGASVINKGGIGEHCCEPHELGDFLFYVTVGVFNRQWVVRRKTTGAEQPIGPIGGHHVFAHDTRYAIMLGRYQPLDDKQAYLRNIVGPIYDTQNAAFVNFLSTSRYFFHPGGGGSVPNLLWVKKSTSNSSADFLGPNDVGGAVTESIHFVSSAVSLGSPVTIEYATIEFGVNNLATSYRLWRRTITLATGVLGTLTEQPGSPHTDLLNRPSFL